MRSSTFFTLAFAALATASIIPRDSSTNFPVCARTCLESADHHGCAAGDDACLCHNADYQKAAQTCILGACQGADLAACFTAQQTTCTGKKRSLVTRQTSSASLFPQCAQSCLTSSPTSCAPTDTACLCKDSNYQQQATQCILGVCSGADLTQCISAGQQLCPTPAPSQLVPRQTSSNLFPQCAQACLTATPTTCAPTDNACLCADTNYQTKATQCVLGACSGSDLTQCLSAQQQICPKPQKRFLVARNSIDQFPQCARKCLKETNHHGCKDGDDKCLCRQPEYQRETSQCILRDCHGDDLKKCYEAEHKVCHR